MIRIVLGNLRESTRADHLRLFGTACVAAVGTVLMLCVMAYAVAGRGDNVARPLFAGVLVLTVTAQLTAVPARLTSSARAERTELLVGPGSMPEQVRELAATEAALAGTLGAVAGVQAHLAARAVFERGMPGGGLIRDVLAVGTEIPFLALVFVLGVVPLTTVLATTSALRHTDPRPHTTPAARTVGVAGPAMIGAGMLAEVLPHAIAPPVRLPGGLGMVHPLAAAGFALIVVGAALSVPWLVHRAAETVVAHTRIPALLCAARRMEADTAALAVPLGLLAGTTTLLVTSRTLHMRGPGNAPGDLPLLALVTAATVCAAAGLLAVLVENARARRDSARNLHMLGAAPWVDRVTLALTVLLPVTVAWGGAAVIGVAATWPLEFGGHEPSVPVSEGAVTAGVTFGMALAAAVAIAVAVVTRRLARGGVTGWGRPATAGVAPPSR
ncbi:hypothetical protein [Yinghuangia sp. YIM S09857]|uniref:hypothetical protein n=1 Tax=Yinghuangia sp. YIM S09857 TaxID=3436929 RepID=UPI003F53D240